MHVSPVPGGCSDSGPPVRGKVCSGAPGITPQLGAHVPKSVLVLCQLDRTEVARGRERKADGIGGTKGKQEMFLVGERLSNLIIKNARPITSREAA